MGRYISEGKQAVVRIATAKTQLVLGISHAKLQLHGQSIHFSTNVGHQFTLATMFSKKSSRDPVALGKFRLSAGVLILIVRHGWQHTVILGVVHILSKNTHLI
jgi:hypothetical protein